MKAKSISAQEFIAFVPGEQIWWLVPPMKEQGVTAKIHGPLIIRRFVPVNLSGWTTMMVEYWDTERQKVYSNYVEVMTSSLGCIFRTEKDAKTCLYSK